MPGCGRAADWRNGTRTQAFQFLHGHTASQPGQLLLTAQVQAQPPPPPRENWTCGGRASVSKPRGEQDGNDGAALGMPLSHFSEVGTFALERKATSTFL